MGAECGFQTKQQLNECILRCPWSEYPLPPVHRACRDGDILSLTYLTIQGDRLAVVSAINARDQFLMWTPIHWAAYFGKVECVKRLVECGLNIDITEGRFEQSAAHLAAFAGHVGVLQWLLESGSSAQKVDSLGETPVHKAARSGCTQCLSLLQAFGAPLSTFNMYRQTPCDLASLLGFEQSVQFLRNHSSATVSSQRKSKRLLDDGDRTEQVKRPRNGVVKYFDHVEILGPNAVNHNLNISPGENQLTHSTNGFLHGHVHDEAFKSTGYNSCLPSKNSDVDMQGEEVQDTAIKTNSSNHYLNQPVRCLSMCSHLQ
ncbi:Ankyrin repeat domain-containing protein 10 [Stylophora pistillata]|uniref:Ankyrin repeat domain-containing protein 10 n=2 Tax=Stylophora pistillata TaxID=50429 RepID=A0A2B4T0I3_STYPI|nr:Ankyrin repeat domain-containing protein 10 [Stylophora pistillata]